MNIMNIYLNTLINYISGGHCERSIFTIVEVFLEGSVAGSMELTCCQESIELPTHSTITLINEK